MAEPFENRRIVITGCTRGIGFETTRMLLEGGAEVLGVARDKERVARTRERLGAGGAFSAVAADLSDPRTASLVAEEVQKRWNALDILINNAGVQDWRKDVIEEPVEVFEAVMTVNLFGPHRITKALIPYLLKGTEPRIINVSSGAGTASALRAGAAMPSYRLSKYALNGLTVLTANGLRGTVAVNSLDPGWLKTDMGGPEAPGAPVDGARRIAALLSKPFEVTGKFWYGDREIEL
jgi:NAD(P)-dependent dehydrogenase (short-subunit alcohol dehydrogenase family)